MDDIKVNQNPKLGSLDRPNSYIEEVYQEKMQKNILMVVDSLLMI